MKGETYEVALTFVLPRTTKNIVSNNVVRSSYVPHDKVWQTIISEGLSLVMTITVAGIALAKAKGGLDNTPVRTDLRENACVLCSQLGVQPYPCQRTAGGFSESCVDLELGREGQLVFRSIRKGVSLQYVHVCHSIPPSIWQPVLVENLVVSPIISFTSARDNVLLDLPLLYVPALFPVHHHLVHVVLVGWSSSLAGDGSPSMWRLSLLEAFFED